jgi:hypothetical protein
MAKEHINCYFSKAWTELVCTVLYCIRYLILILCSGDGHAAQLVHNQPVHFYKIKMTILK